MNNETSIVNNPDEIYAVALKKAEAAKNNGRPFSRFAMLGIISDELGMGLNQNSVNLVEKLYTEGLLKE